MRTLSLLAAVLVCAAAPALAQNASPPTVTIRSPSAEPLWLTIASEGIGATQGEAVSVVRAAGFLRTAQGVRYQTPVTIAFGTEQPFRATIRPANGSGPHRLIMASGPAVQASTDASRIYLVRERVGEAVRVYVAGSVHLLPVPDVIR